MANYTSSHTGAEIDSAVGRTKDTVVTAGTVAASSAVVVDANKDISGFRNVTLTGQLQAATINLTGDTTIGDGDTDNITINADVNSNIIPNTDNTFDLGSSSKQWKDLYVNGIGYIDQLGTAADPIAIYESSGEIDGTAIGSESASTGAFTTISASGNVDFNGDLDVDGTTNLDAVDIDGAVDMASTLDVGDVFTVDKSVSAGDLNTAPIVTFKNSQGSGHYTSIKFEGADSSGANTGFLGYLSHNTSSTRRFVFSHDGTTRDVAINGDGSTTFNKTITVGASNGSEEVKANRTRVRHIDGLADASDYSHGDLFINHISSGNIICSSNVGIGETSPLGRLHIEGDTSDYGIVTRGPSGYGSISSLVSGKSVGWSVYPVTNGSYTDLQFGAFDAASTGTKVTFASGGNVGIGTDSPSQKLHVVGKMKLTDDLIIGGTSPRIDYDGGSSGALRFFSTSANTERMRITSGGKVLIGTTSGNNIHNNGLRIVSNEVGSHYGDVALSLEGSGGDFYALNFAVQNAFFGFLAASSPTPDFLSLAYRTGSTDSILIQFFANGNATLAGTLTENSDIRLKENIENIDGALSKVNQMRGVTFDRIDTGKKEYGMIADELEEIIPELVDTADDGDIEKEIPNLKSIKYTKLTSILIEAVKELSAQNDALTARIEALENA